jgi:hypothetical protein
MVKPDSTQNKSKIRIFQKKILAELSLRSSDAGSTKPASMRDDYDYSHVNLSAGKFSLKDVRPVTAKRVATSRQPHLIEFSGDRFAN